MKEAADSCGAVMPYNYIFWIWENDSKRPSMRLTWIRMRRLDHVRVHDAQGDVEFLTAMFYGVVASVRRQMKSHHP